MFGRCQAVSASVLLGVLLLGPVVAAEQSGLTPADKEAWARAARELAENPNLVTTGNVAVYLEASRHVAESKLATARRGRVSPKAKKAVEWQTQYDRVVYRTVQDKEKEIARWEAEAASPLLPAFPTHVAKKPGQLGRLQYGGTTYRVLQILADDLALIVATSGRNEWTFQLRAPRVATMQEGQRFPCNAYRNRRDNDGIPGVFRVGERVQYTTVLGAGRTVDLLEEVDLDELLEGDE